MGTIRELPSNNGGGEHTLLYATLFLVAMFISTSLLLLASILYIAELIGSLMLSLLLIGTLLLVIAAIIYIVKLRPTLRAINEQLQTIYEMSSLAQMGYNWVMNKVEQWIMKL